MKTSPLRFLLAMLLSLAAIVLAIEYNGMRQFGGMDHSTLIYVAWRLLSGQMPYHDFICTLPPAFYLGAYGALKVWGSHWRSFVHLAALWAAISFLAQVHLSQKCGMGKWLSLLYAFCCQALASIYVAYWWYNPYTVSACLVLYLCVTAYVANPAAKSVPVAMVLIAVAVALSKPNLGLPMLLLSAAVSFFSARDIKTWAISWGAAGILSVGLLMLCGIRPMDVFHSYQSVAVSRGVTLKGLQCVSSIERHSAGIWVLLALLFFGITWAPVLKKCAIRNPWKLAALFSRRGDPALPLLVLSAGIFLAGCYSMLSNAEPKFEDMTLLLAPSIVAFGLFPVKNQGAGKRLFLSGFCGALALALLLSAISLECGFSRRRIKAIGVGAFYEKQLASAPLDNAFFSGMKTGDRFVRVLNQVEATLKQANPSAEVFFGPKMEFCYAAFAIPAPKHVPLWWEPGAAFPASDLPRVVADWNGHRFPLLIFLKDDFTYIPSSLKDILNTSYVRDESLGDISVFHRKPE